MNITDINSRINKEICNKTILEISDTYLMDEYKECKSTKNKIKKLEDILIKYNITNNIINLIINEFLLELIPPGTKGVIRGNKFNNIVKNYILKINLDINKFEICFEKQSILSKTNEIPDWYILEKINNKLLIGMNQLDLWNGGQQLNRGYKYLINNINNNENTKLICVICNKIKITNNKNKIYKLFNTGFENNTLCYLNNLENIIKKYFNL
jgi:hypothetical protein